MEGEVTKQTPIVAQSLEPIAGPGIMMTQQQLADASGLSRHTIMRIERDALSKIRDELRRQGFDPSEDLP